MTTLSTRAAVSCSLLTLAAACASGNPATKPAEQPMVTSRDLERNPGEPIEKTIQDKVPGVLVTRTEDGGIAVQIRGAASFNMGTQPLYVVDDVPISPGPGGALTGVNPYDIESIRVLKDPADIGVYGMRGANGVIVVKTRRPGRRAR